MRSSLHRIQNWPALAATARFHASELARLVRYSPRQLERFLAEEFRQTPRQWLDQQQMAAAKELLLVAKRVKEVAETLGFRDQSHLSRKFKHYFGQSPTEFISRPAKTHVAKRPKRSH